MIKILKIILITLILGGLTVPLASCASKSEAAPVLANQIVTVQRGNLIIDITAVGNLALSRAEDLAFDIFYPEATVEEVLVEEAESVEEGQVLAKLDTSEWEDELATLEDKVTAAERQLTSKKRDLAPAEINLINAKIALEDAEANYVWPEEIFAARENVLAAEREVKEAQAMLRGEEAVYDSRTGALLYYKELKTAWDVEVWTTKLAEAEAKLRTRQVELDKLLTESAADANVSDAEAKLRWCQDRLDILLAQYAALAEEPTEETKAEIEEQIAIARKQVELAQEQLEDAQKTQEEVVIKKLQLEITQGKLEDAQIAIEDAQKALEDAQEDLEEAKSKSPVITAPFDGFITKVNVEGGDEVMTGTVAVQLADPTKFEAEVMVSEMDISQVKLEGEAWVQVDAMPGLSLPAKVTHISPTATIQSGIVNYTVKVELESLEALMQEQREARQEAMQKIEQGELPERLKQAIEEGQITREQAEEMMKQRQQGEGGQQAMPAMMPEDFQLREGLTVTVSILVEERNDVLLVPNQAITRRGQETYVQVVSPDGTIEERVIQTGISDWQYTEVIEGLSEGEKVVVPEGTTTTPATSQQGQRPPGGIVPGMGRMLH